MMVVAYSGHVHMTETEYTNPKMICDYIIYTKILLCFFWAIISQPRNYALLLLSSGLVLIDQTNATQRSSFFWAIISQPCNLFHEIQ